MKFRKHIISVILLIILCILALGSSEEVTDDNWREHDGSVRAFVDAQFIVRDYLKAPSTAKFASILDSKVTRNPSNQEYIIVSYVDSQNGFGAMIRMHFKVKLKRTGKDDFELISVNF